MSNPRIIILTLTKIEMSVFIQNIPTDLDLTKITESSLRSGMHIDLGNDPVFANKLYCAIENAARGPMDTVRDDYTTDCPYLEIINRPARGEFYMHSRYLIIPYNDPTFFDSDFPTLVDKDFNIVSTMKRNPKEQKDWDETVRFFRLQDRVDSSAAAKSGNCGGYFCNRQVKIAVNDPSKYTKLSKSFHITTCCGRLMHKDCITAAMKYNNRCIHCRGCIAVKEFKELCLLDTSRDDDDICE